MPLPQRPIGDHLRDWRTRRRMSQLDLACEAGISPRHLSFVETGRSRPSREMILHLAEYLAVPVRERNVLLVSAGFAPVFAERPLNDPALAAVREAIELVLQAQKPFPAFALDRHWQVVDTNHALPELFEGVRADLLQGPLNVLRISLHPEGLAPRIVNLPEIRAHLLFRLQRQIDLTADATLIELQREVLAYPSPARGEEPSGSVLQHAVAVPFRVRCAGTLLSFYTTTTVFGTPLDVTLSELAIENFIAADRHTAQTVRRLAGLAPDAAPENDARAA